MAKSLYITYDGLTDPLGQSQILPYLKGLSTLGHEIHIISCEKPERFNKGEDTIEAIVQEASLHWHPIPYTAKPPIFSTLKDVRKIFRLAEKLHESNGFDTVHCRSYIAGLAGLSMKRKYSVPFIFDMRGFWIEERTEGGLWNLNVPWYRTVFNYFKKKEKSFLAEADHVVVLTNRAKNHLESTFKVNGDNISVIPCCADEDHFNSEHVPAHLRATLKAELKVDESKTVIGYLGSLGTWYALDEMISFFCDLKAQQPNAHFVLASNDPAPIQLSTHPEYGKSIICTTLSRNQVPAFLSLLDACIYFIRPTFSKTASCPTKLGEALLMGVPVITNPGIGDIEEIAQKLDCGRLISMDSPHIQLAELNSLLQDNDKVQLAKASKAVFGLSSGIQAYNSIYTAISTTSS